MRRRCDRTDWHISHQWGLEHGDMGVAWYECPGVQSWDTDDRGVAPQPNGGES